MMEGTTWRTKLVISITLLPMASESPLLRLLGAEARGPFCCPRMIFSVSRVSQPFVTPELMIILKSRRRQWLD
uniref:Secreted protein n=1 Tax=Gossypium raimondii TaxID=29730 RepID=A0A0D2SBT8_GOSRA|nr:hypothetical protein B456_013G103700 [Gossypium raimondii]